MHRVKRIDTMHAIRIFDGTRCLALDRCGRFERRLRSEVLTRAAALWNHAQTSTTAQVHVLKEELGVPLFDRLARHHGSRERAWSQAAINGVPGSRD
jgi:hypothetical protein